MAAVTSDSLGGRHAISPDAVLGELERILVSDSFRASKRLSAFLRFIVEHAVRGQLDQIKEYRIGAEVYGRGPQFDPRIDNIVRVEANRLRTKLRDYYERFGGDDSIRIEIPKGTYLPVFQMPPALDHAPRLAEPTITPVEQPSKPGHSLAFRRAALALVLAAVCLLGFWYFHSRQRAVKFRRSIAVLGFKDIRGGHSDNAWLSTAVSEMLTMDLAAEGQVRTVPVDSISEMKRDLRLTDSDGFTRTVLDRVRGRSGADWVIAGAYTVLGDADTGQIRLDVRVQETGSGNTVATLSETGNEGRLFDLADRTAMRLRRKLGLPASAGETRVMAALPSNTGAMRLYSEGIDKLRASNAVAAREILERAVEADPSNPFAHSALGAAWDALGYEVKAQDSARRAYQLASDLSRTEQLQIEGRFRTYAHQWDQAIRIYQNLCRMEPDSIDDALMLAETQRLASRPRDALVTVENLRTLVSPLRDDPRIDFAGARALGDLGDFRRAREAAIAVERKALALGLRLLYAKARLFESGTMQNLGIPQAGAVRREARCLCADLGDQACVVSALRVEANQTLFSSPAIAKKLYEQGLEISRDMGSRRETMNLLEGLGAAFADLDDSLSAEKSYTEGLAIARETGNPSGVNAFQIDLANVYTSEGRLADANTMYRRAISFGRGTGRQDHLGNALAGLAQVLRLEGKLSEARQAANEAVTVFRATGEVYETADALTILGDCLLDSGEIEPARKDYEEARTLRLGSRADIALASALLETHQPAAAQARAAEAIRILQAAQNARDDALGRAVLIRAMLAQGKVSEALWAVKGVASANPRNPYARLILGIAVARAQAATGHYDEALKQLSFLMSEAGHFGYAGVVLEARLAHGEILAQSENSRAGIAELNSVAREADLKGLALIAREARGKVL